MDEVQNPFALGAGNPPAALTGRDPEIKQFKTLLGRLHAGRSAQSLVISGLRGVGKTVLLVRFGEIAATEEWIAPDPVEIKSDTSFRSEIADLAYRALIDLSSRRALGERLRRLGRFLAAFKVGLSAEGVDVSFDPDKIETGSAVDLERDLTRLFVELGDVARSSDTGVVFLIDEMQFLKKPELEALAAAMHRLSQKQLPIALAGAGLPQLPGQLVDAKSYSERLFAFPRLDKLDAPAAAAAITLPLNDERVEIHANALRRLIQLSDRYPAFIQGYAEETWNIAPESPITLADVETAAPQVLARLDEQFFHVRFEKATPKEREYMSAMADLGDGPKLSSAVASRLGKRPNAVAPHRDSLIKKGLIYSPQHGLVDFTVPHFADFMRRRYPFRGEH